MRLNLKPIRDQTIVITGASSGIGLATARQAAEAGARVFLVSRNEAALARICHDLTARGYEAAFAVADVGDAAALRAAAQQAIARFDGFDAWVNIAGVAIYAKLLDTPIQEHARLFRTNYWGVVNGAAAAIPHLKKYGGAFITIGSVASDIGTPILGAYAASKHAVKGFIDSLRIELIAERAPVSVTLIKPSGIASPLPEHAANHFDCAVKSPPPTYAPELVADVILHAVTHQRREITVGGVGFLQIIGAAHTPHLMDRISAAFIPLMKDTSRRREAKNNLFEAGFSGEVRSRFQSSRRVSLYTTGTLHSFVVAGLGALALGIALAAAARARR
ncbi:SDR family oxidoreductase [Microvirga brassicacearum]|uniref:SDR family NAD(P)-dependent oxidoreductase n=1 Tax=Microvirga brassicacearum TaxID=2580413 RepID=A0A5N3P5K0_9HYPH|nr:SDR family oxidoreductase [Microvirga brassicacearum]KAB0265004.1 SDR family NAD(P)-dependent oxidoreductase [Microvirga brassicacearum]